MQYRLYSGPRGAEQIRAIEKDKMLFKAFTLGQQGALASPSMSTVRPNRA